MSSTQYDDAILDSNAIDPTDKNGNPIPVTIPIMLAPGVKVVYTTRLGGSSEGDFAHFNLGGKSGDDPEHVLANRVALADVLDAKISLISQVHSGDAVDVDESFTINQPFGFDVSGTKTGAESGTAGAEDGSDDPAVIEADGQVTSQKHVALGMFAADCLPVLMADPEAGIIGAAHCGRRGLQKGVIGATVGKMVAKGAKAERIVVTLGPCICGDCYEVGGDIADEFDAQFPGTFTLSRFGQPGIDIAAAGACQGGRAGRQRRILASARQRGHAVSVGGRGAGRHLRRRRRGRFAARRAFRQDPSQPVHVREPAVVLASPRFACRENARRPHAGADRARMISIIRQTSKRKTEGAK